MVRVRDLEVGFTMKPQIANGFIPVRSVFGYGFIAMRSVFGFAMRERKTQHKERDRLCVREREVGGEGYDIRKLSSSEG